MISALSYNVRGITTSRKQLLLREWIEANPHDAVLLQELHMTKKEQLESFKKIFPGYNITCSLGTWAAGGTMIMTKHRLRVVDSGTDDCGRVAFVKVLTNSGAVVIASVYAPAQPQERCEFFEHLHLQVPSAQWTLIGGDFNCSPDHVKDRSEQKSRPERRSYAALDRHFLQPLSLTELFRSKHPRSAAYSYHSDTRSTHCRIDFFVGTELVRRSVQRIVYLPIGLSDHDGLSVTLSFPTTATTVDYRRWICNTEVLKRPSFLKRFQRIWDILCLSSNFDGIDWWTDLKTSLTLLLQDEQKQMTREARRDIKDLQSQYRALAENPSADNLTNMTQVRGAIQQLLEARAATRTHGHCGSDQTLGEIAQTRVASTRTNQSWVHFLNHPIHGRVQTKEAMVEVATDFYRELYREKPIDKATWPVLFDGVPKLNGHERECLEREITAAECYEALCAMPERKSPGDDGITVEVWRAIFPIIGEHYVSMINSARQSGFQPEFLRALLTLIKKKGASEGQMKDFRPLSLMNIDYKILSKVLSTRLRKVLGSIVHRDQSCGIPGRNIQDNVLVIRALIEHQRMIRDPVGIILWDQEKAFDRVNHQYLLATLKNFGFGPEFMKWVKLLYTNGSFRVKVNDGISMPIPFESGVRQGCSLSGSLFVICLEPLMHRIRSNRAIPGILPPGGQYANIREIALARANTDEEQVRIKAVAYADDVSTIVRNSDEEGATIAMFDLYNTASGAKTNSTKTELLWVSDWLSPPRFQAKIRCDWCTFLGVPIDTKGQLPICELERKVSKIKQQIGYWSQINLSLTERATVTKVFILSQLIYWLSLMPVPAETLERVQRTILAFFWKAWGPRMNFRTIIGPKDRGGFTLPDIETMVSSLRIKCGIQLINRARPAAWKFYAMIRAGAQLRQHAPWIWSNLVPHIVDGSSFFHEVAARTAKWLRSGGQPIRRDQEPSIYWQLTAHDRFRRPVCERKRPYLNEIQFHKLLRASLPNQLLDFWVLLANYGIHTRSRLGHNDESRRCHLCNAVETIPHLFTQCPALVTLFDILNEKVQAACGKTLNRCDESIIYLKEINQMSEDPKIRKKIVYLTGCYLHAVWSYRNSARHQHRRPDGPDISAAIRLLQTATARLPFDNG